MIALHKQNPTLQSANTEFFQENSKDKVFGYVRWNNRGAQVVVAANFSERFSMAYKILKFPSLFQQASSLNEESPP